MKSSAATLSQHKSVLISVAESIGSALGTIAAKAHAVEDLARDPRTASTNRSANRLVQKVSKTRRHTATSRPEGSTRTKLEKNSRRGSDNAASTRRRQRAARTKSLHK